MNKFTLTILCFAFLFRGGATSVQARGLFDNRTLAFQENKGQIHDQHNQYRRDIDARIGQDGFQVFIGKGGLHYQWTRVAPESRARLTGDASHSEPYTTVASRIDVELIDYNPKATLKKMDKSSTYYWYYNVQSAPEGILAYEFNKMVYENIYPDIDWVIYTRDNQLKYDFVVRPGGRVADIKLRYSGARQLTLDATGNLIVASDQGAVTEAAPLSYQQDGTIVASRYALNGDVLSFSVADYKGQLTIDPTVDWATFFGEAFGFWVTGEGMKLDKAGNMYVGGNALATQNLATAGAYQIMVNNISSGYLAKFTMSGQLDWCTYFGGDVPVANGHTTGALAIDSLGNITVIATTPEPAYGITTTGAYQTAYGGGDEDGFLMQFTPSGQRRWGTFLGGEGKERAFSLAIHGGYIYIGGITDSKTGIATAGSYKTSVAAGDGPASFLTKMDLEGKKVEWSTYHDENATDLMAIAADPAGSIYMQSGTTTKTGFATANAFQKQHNSPAGTQLYCGTISKFTGEGKLSWATFWGGENEYDGYSSSGAAIVADKDYRVYLVAETRSRQYMATAGSYQDSVYGGTSDVCLMRLDTAGNRVWATYMGGEEQEQVKGGMTVDDLGRLWISGYTGSTQNIVTADGIQLAYGGGSTDAFVQRWDSNGQKQWGTYYGGSGDLEEIRTLAYQKGYLYFSGTSNSKDSLAIATPGAHQVSYPGELFFSSILGRFCFADAPRSGISGPTEVCAGKTFRYTIDDDVAAEVYIWNIPAGWSAGGEGTKELSLQFPEGSSGTLELQLVRCEDTSDIIQLSIAVVEMDKPVIQVEKDQLSVAPSFASYQWRLNTLPIPNATQSNYRATENGKYSVIVTNELNCADTSDEYLINNLFVAGSERASSIRVYPNPVQQNNLYIDAAEVETVAIYGIDGRWITTVTNRGSVDVAHLPNGSYMLYLSDKSGALIQASKFQIMRP